MSMYDYSNGSTYHLILNNLVKINQKPYLDFNTTIFKSLTLFNYINKFINVVTE